MRGIVANGGGAPYLAILVFVVTGAVWCVRRVMDARGRRRGVPDSTDVAERFRRRQRLIEQETSRRATSGEPDDGSPPEAIDPGEEASDE